MFKWLLSTECNLTLNHYLHVCHEFLVKNWDIEKTPTFFMINRTKESYQLVTFVPYHESLQVIIQTKIIFCLFIGKIWTFCRTSLIFRFLRWTKVLTQRIKGFLIFKLTFLFTADNNPDVLTQKPEQRQKWLQSWIRINNEGQPLAPRKQHQRRLYFGSFWAYIFYLA